MGVYIPTVTYAGPCIINGRHVGEAYRDYVQLCVSANSVVTAANAVVVALRGPYSWSVAAKRVDAT